MTTRITLIITFAALSGLLAWGTLMASESAAVGESQKVEAKKQEATCSDKEEQEVSEIDEELFAELMEYGKEVFEMDCAVCHGAEGGGQIGPPLRQNVADARGVIRAIIAGRGNMPPVAADYPDDKVAAVVTYVRNSWSNEYGLVTEADVAEHRP